MAQLIDNFSKYYQVIAISTRGHGKSELGTKPYTYEQKTKDVIAVLNEVTKDSVTVFGFSDGGYTGYYLASLFPEKVKQMVIIGAAETYPGDYRINLKVNDIMKLDKTYWEQQLKLMPEPNRLQEMFDKVSDATTKMHISKDFFATIKCPVLVMAGNHDQFLNTQRVVNASKMIPKAELAIIPNTTHAAFLENFPAVWSVTSSFLKIPTNNNIQQSKDKIIMNNPVEQILMHHLIAFGDNNLDEILKDYTEQSVIMTPNGVIKGLTKFRKFFEDFFEAIPTGSSFTMKQKNIEGNVAYITWASKSSAANIPMGTDTFVFEGDKILYHTVADYRL
jgi:pimeloyl-ACP methyl ester carboxylesterase